MTIPYVKRFILPFLFVICTFFLVLSAVALLLTWPFDKSRRIVHELSRILVRIFYAVPPLWKFRVTGREYIDRRKPYVIVVNHQAGLDIPTLYFVPLNFRWVSKREVFKVPFSASSFCCTGISASTGDMLRPRWRR